MNPDGLVSLQTVFVLCLVFSLLIVAFLLVVVFLRLTNLFQEKKYIRLEQDWDRRFLLYLDGDLELETMPRVEKSELLYWERYLYGYLKNIRGRERELIGELSRHTGLTAHLLHLLQRGTRWEKARSARFLGTLGEKRAIKYLRRNLQNRDYVVSLAAARGLAAIGDWDSFHEIIRVLLQSYYTYEAVSEILVDFGEQSCPLVHQLLKNNVLVSAYRQAPLFQTGHEARASQSQFDNALQLRIRRESELDIEKPEVLCLYIDFLAYFNYLPADRTIQKIMELSDIEEVTIRCLKALERIASPETATSLVLFLQHENWIVRSQSAKALGSVNPEAYLDELHHLLSDQNWWVRFRAGEALLKAGSQGLERLKQLTEQEGEPAEMAVYMLERLEKG